MNQHVCPASLCRGSPERVTQCWNITPALPGALAPPELQGCRWRIIWEEMDAHQMTEGGSSRRARVKPGGSLENSQSSHPAEITSETRSVWWCLPSQLQGVQAFLPTQRMLHSHFVCHLRGRDVNLGVLGGALPCQRHQTSTLRFVL